MLKEDIKDNPKMVDALCKMVAGLYSLGGDSSMTELMGLLSHSFLSLLTTSNREGDEFKFIGSILDQLFESAKEVDSAQRCLPVLDVNVNH